MSSSIPEQLGAYQVLGLLGSGGMGEVFLGRREGPGGFSRAVVLKRLLPHLARKPSIRAMFLDEARIVASIRHRNVVQVQELGEDGDDLFIAMEYLEGETLLRLIRRCVAVEGSVPYREATYIMAEVAAGLSAAHGLRDENGRAQHVVHRDVTPSNIFVTYDGQIKLIDFGIARASDRLHQTEPGLIRGTTAYMSPEQVTGRTTDARSDIFSFGVVLYELTTCRRLFKRATHHDTHRAILEGSFPAPWFYDDAYPMPLGQVTLKCLSRRPEGRYVDCTSLRAELGAVLDALPGPGTPTERLAGMMQALFSDRRAAQSKMLGRLQRGQPVSKIDMPSNSEDDAADDGLPIAAAPDAVSMTSLDPPSSSLPEDRGPKPRAIAFSAAIAVSMAMGFIAVALSTGRLSFETDERTALTPVFDLIELRVDTEPSGATVTVAGVALGTTPIRFNVPAAQSSVALSLAFPGFEPRTVVVSPRTQTRLLVRLKPEQPAADLAAPPAPRPAPRSEPAPAIPAAAAAIVPKLEANPKPKPKAKPKRTARPKARTRRGVPTSAQADESDYEQIDDWQDF